MTDRLLVVRTGVANLASILAGLRRVGATPELTESARQIREAERVVLPGVGAFGAVMARLHELGLIEAVRERILAQRPTLAICLGLQVLAESSEESPGVAGLGILPAQVTRFPETVRVPQLGWNRITARSGCRLLESGYMYFANSYRLSAPPQGWSVATAPHGGDFVAAIERGPVLACQFHPELSGQAGIALLERWFTAKGGDPC